MYSYDEVIHIIYQAKRFGKLTGIEVTGRILEQLGHPEKKLPYIHVAGTNGKGSTCAFLTQILMEEGKKVGTFVSPHLVDFEERIRINNEYIPKEKVTELANFLLEQDFGIELTMFDYCLVMAILYFVQEECDIAVIETGLGGRYDSTNALGTPLLTAITKIGYDHVAILGDTLTQIAKEKAGICKKGVPLVLEIQEQEAKQALLEEASHIGAEPILEVTTESMQQIRTFSIGLPGEYQLENAALAVLCARQLKISEASIKKGLSNVSWTGRMQILQKQPFLMVDGAHNGNGVEALYKSLTTLYPQDKFHFIMGVMADKDYEQMIEIIYPIARDFVTVTVESERSLQSQQLAACIEKRGIPAGAADTLEEALATVSGEYKTVVFGSLYFIGEVLKKTN